MQMLSTRTRIHNKAEAERMNADESRQVQQRSGSEGKWASMSLLQLAHERMENRFHGGLWSVTKTMKTNCSIGRTLPPKVLTGLTLEINGSRCRLLMHGLRR